MTIPTSITAADLTWTPANQPGQPPHFDGDVRRASVPHPAGSDGWSGSNVGLVRFVNGARTYWHQHPGEQILVVVEGECRYGSETQPAAVAGAGQVIRMPGGQRHWHGAVAGGSMTHLTITHGGAAEWFGPVAP